MCYLLIEEPSQAFGSLEMCLNAWGEAMTRLRALTVPQELIRIVERTVAVDPLVVSSRATTNLPIRKWEEILAALEQVSSVLEVESSDAVG
jgi:hypothetical protein